MIKISKIALLLYIVSATIFLLPNLFRADNATFKSVHNRDKIVLQNYSDFFLKPALFFDNVSLYASHNNYFATRSVIWLKKIARKVGLSGSDQVIRNGDFYFLTKHSIDNKKNSALQKICPAEAEYEKITVSLKDELANTGAYLSFFDMTLRYIVVPSKPVIYAEKLEGFVPHNLLNRCKMMGTDMNPVFQALANLSQADNLKASYPLFDFIKLKDQPAFYPPQNFHAQSMSSKVAVNVAGISPNSVSLKSSIKKINPDLGNILGIREAIEVHDYDYSKFGVTNTSVIKHAEFLKNNFDELAFSFSSKTPTNPYSVIVTGDSFAGFMIKHIAPHYQETYLIKRTLRAREQQHNLYKRSKNLNLKEIMVVVHDLGARSLRKYLPDFRNLVHFNSQDTKYISGQGWLPPVEWGIWGMGGHLNLKINCPSKSLKPKFGVEIDIGSYLNETNFQVLDTQSNLLYETSLSEKFKKIAFLLENKKCENEVQSIQLISPAADQREKVKNKTTHSIKIREINTF